MPNSCDRSFLLPFPVIETQSRPTHLCLAQVAASSAEPNIETLANRPWLRHQLPIHSSADHAGTHSHFPTAHRAAEGTQYLQLYGSVGETIPKKFYLKQGSWWLFWAILLLHFYSITAHLKYPESVFTLMIIRLCIYATNKHVTIPLGGCEGGHRVK